MFQDSTYILGIFFQIGRTFHIFYDDYRIKNSLINPIIFVRYQEFFALSGYR